MESLICGTIGDDFDEEIERRLVKDDFTSAENGQVLAATVNERGRNLDLTSETASSAASQPSQSGRFLGVTFDCCGVYSRIYPNQAGDAYEGRCPRCGGFVKVGIGPGGSSNRFFTAS